MHRRQRSIDLFRQAHEPFLLLMYRTKVEEDQKSQWRNVIYETCRNRYGRSFGDALLAPLHASMIISDTKKKHILYLNVVASQKDYP